MPCALRPLILIDCFRESLNSPSALSRALRSLDGSGHRLVRITSADAKDTPMTATVALALGADSVVVPVRSAAEARAVRDACSYKGTRSLSISPELPYHVAKSPAAGIELLEFPHSEFDQSGTPPLLSPLTTAFVLRGESGRHDAARRN